jgi:adenosylcobinamide-GDP ribazoletransferase
LKSILKPLEELAALTGFLTVIPTGEHSIKKAAKGLYWTPLIGLLLGLTGILPYYTPLPLQAATVLALILLYGLTGLLHLDGYADFCDTLGSGLTGSDALIVLKDPRRGAKAVGCIVVQVVSVYGLIESVAKVNPILIAVSTAGAYEALYTTALIGRPSEYRGLGSIFITEAKGRIAHNMIVLALIGAVIYVNWRTTALAGYAASLAAGIVSSVYSAWKAHNVLGMVNGDVIGFSLEVSRLLALISILPLIYH